MMENNTSIWVVADQVDGQVLSVAYQLVGKASALAGPDTTVEVVLLGQGVEQNIQQLIAAGADKVYVGDSPALAPYQSEKYTELIAGLAEKYHPKIMLLASTYMGRELAPLIAAKLKTGLTAHCIDLLVNEEGVLEQKIPAYGGLLTIVCPEKRPQMATVAKGVFPDPVFDMDRTGVVEQIEIPTDLPDRIKTIEVVLEEPKGIPLESAPVVIAGGAGAGNAEGWEQIAELADLLNAALGCTRPAADEGWSTLDDMIGQSGKMVHPEVYLGIGLSGELQHMVGISDAKIMAAVNIDPKSPVFEQVDYGIVDDCREFVPVLIDTIKNHIS